jgi:hypothetical protein
MQRTESQIGKLFKYVTKDKYFVNIQRPPPWANGQSFWLQNLRFRVRFPAVPNFLRSGGSGTGSTQPREYN